MVYRASTLSTMNCSVDVEDLLGLDPFCSAEQNKPKIAQKRSSRCLKGKFPISFPSGTRDRWGGGITIFVVLLDTFSILLVLLGFCSFCSAFARLLVVLLGICSIVVVLLGICSIFALLDSCSKRVPIARQSSNCSASGSPGGLWSVADAGEKKVCDK